jgi:hypothetical protein
MLKDWPALILATSRLHGKAAAGIIDEWAAQATLFILPAAG